MPGTRTDVTHLDLALVSAEPCLGAVTPEGDPVCAECGWLVEEHTDLAGRPLAAAA